MTLQKFVIRVVIVIVSLFSCQLITGNPEAFAAGREVAVPDLQSQPGRPPRTITIRQAVEVSLRNYPLISQKIFKLRAAKANVKLAKTQYLPNLNLDLQESAASSNRVASLVMNNVSGFDTVPVDTGPV